MTSLSNEGGNLYPLTLYLPRALSTQNGGNQALVFHCCCIIIRSSDEIPLNYVPDSVAFTIDLLALEAKGFAELLAHEESFAPSS